MFLSMSDEDAKRTSRIITEMMTNQDAPMEESSEEDSFSWGETGTINALCGAANHIFFSPVNKKAPSTADRKAPINDEKAKKEDHKRGTKEVPVAASLPVSRVAAVMTQEVDETVLLKLGLDTITESVSADGKKFAYKLTRTAPYDQLVIATRVESSAVRLTGWEVKQRYKLWTAHLKVAPVITNKLAAVQATQ